MEAFRAFWTTDLKGFGICSLKLVNCMWYEMTQKSALEKKFDFDQSYESEETSLMLDRVSHAPSVFPRGFLCRAYSTWILNGSKVWDLEAEAWKYAA